MFEVKNIRKEFCEDFWKEPFVALHDLSFAIEEGKITGFLGANGAGKTTFLKILLNFITPTSGEISFINKMPKNEIFQKLGYMPERPYYYEYLTGREFLIYVGKLQNVEGKRLNDAISRWTKELKVDFALDRSLKSYSKGMLQRIGFAGALLHNPSLVVLDEPLSGLDPIGRKEFKDILIKINREYNCTVFFSSHIVSDVEEVSENVIVIDKGSLVYQGNINELLNQSSSNLVKLELSSLPESFLQENKDIIVRTGTGINEYVFCTKENQRQLISEAYSKNVDIISINRESLTLEEVVYNLNG